MGWTFYRKPQGATDIELMREEATGRRDGKGERHQVLADAIVRGVWYAAVTGKEPGEVFAAVGLIENKGGEFGCKLMSEEMGPYYYDAPASVLAALSPTKYESANEWRAKCGMPAGVITQQPALI